MSNINNIEDYNVNNNDDKTDNDKTLGLSHDPESLIARRHLHAHLQSNTSSSPSLCLPLPLSQERSSMSSQPERDTTVIHTHSSNFRDIVQQLTGPSRDNHDLLPPVMLPFRLTTNKKTTSHNNNVTHNTKLAPQYTNGDLQDVRIPPARDEGMIPSNQGVNTVMTSPGPASNSDQLGLRKAPLKLHERRKFMSNMKNLTTTTTTTVLQQLYVEQQQQQQKEVSTSRDPTTPKYIITKPTLSSPYHYYNNPSPVTPLASDFERFCTAATTPTSSSSSRAISALNPPSINTYNETLTHSDYRCSFSNALDSTCPISLMSNNNYTNSMRFPLPKSSVDYGHDNDLHMNVILRSGPQSPHESLGFFLQRHSHPPTIADTGIGATTHTTTDQKASPTLLNLFPESPEFSPRHG